MENTEDKKFYPRKAVFAFLLSILTPGLGQIYNGQARKGLLFFFGLLSFVICFHLLGLNVYFWVYFAAICIEVLSILLIATEAALTACKQKKYELKKYNQWYVYLLSILFCILALDTISNATRYKILKIQSDSCNPNIFVGDRVLGDFKIYNHQEPDYGDLVVFLAADGANYVFRVIGLPNDTLSIENQLVKYKNKPFSWKPIPNSLNKNDETEEFLGTLPNGVAYQFIANKISNNAFQEIVVPDNSYFLLGDNRDLSADSRYIGFVKREQIKGKLLLLYFSKDFKRINKKL